MRIRLAATLPSPGAACCSTAAAAPSPNSAAISGWSCHGRAREAISEENTSAVRHCPASIRRAGGLERGEEAEAGAVDVEGGGRTIGQAEALHDQRRGRRQRLVRHAATADDQIDIAGLEPGIGERQARRRASKVNLQFGLADIAFDDAGGGLEMAVAKPQPRVESCATSRMRAGTARPVPMILIRILSPPLELRFSQSLDRIVLR